MKQLKGRASVAVSAPRQEIFRFLAAVEDYPGWYPDAVRAVQVLERDAGGDPARIRARLHIARGPLVKDFDLTMVVHIDPQGSVSLVRVSQDPGDRERFEVTWRLGQDARLSVDLDANVSVPRLVPVGGLADSIARGFVEAAARRLGSAVP